MQCVHSDVIVDNVDTRHCLLIHSRLVSVSYMMATVTYHHNHHGNLLIQAVDELKNTGEVKQACSQGGSLGADEPPL